MEYSDVSKNTKSDVKEGTTPTKERKENSRGNFHLRRSFEMIIFILLKL